MNEYCLITFKSITYAMQFEKLMKDHNMDIKIIPVPRSISASCGMCGRFDVKKKQRIIELCDKNNITYEQIHNM